MTPDRSRLLQDSFGGWFSLTQVVSVSVSTPSQTLTVTLSNGVSVTPLWPDSDAPWPVHGLGQFLLLWDWALT